MTRLRAMVLDDEPVARRLLVQLIEETDLAEVVGVASDVAEALQVLRASPVDVAFVDVRLPGGESGLDLIRLLDVPDLREPGSGRVHRPLFVLATAVERHALRAFELGVVDYLLKPLSSTRVEQSLRRVSSLLELRADLRD
jgi:two-component system, LytTR family, response regulator